MAQGRLASWMPGYQTIRSLVSYVNQSISRHQNTPYSLNEHIDALYAQYKDASESLEKRLNAIPHAKDWRFLISHFECGISMDIMGAPISLNLLKNEKEHHCHVMNINSLHDLKRTNDKAELHNPYNQSPIKVIRLDASFMGTINAFVSDMETFSREYEQAKATRALTLDNTNDLIAYKKQATALLAREEMIEQILKPLREVESYLVLYDMDSLSQYEQFYVEAQQCLRAIMPPHAIPNQSILDNQVKELIDKNDFIKRELAHNQLITNWLAELCSIKFYSSELENKKNQHIEKFKERLYKELCRCSSDAQIINLTQLNSALLNIVNEIKKTKDALQQEHEKELAFEQNIASLKQLKLSNADLIKKKQTIIQELKQSYSKELIHSSLSDSASTLKEQTKIQIEQLKEIDRKEKDFGRLIKPITDFAHHIALSPRKAKYIESLQPLLEACYTGHEVIDKLPNLNEKLPQDTELDDLLLQKVERKLNIHIKSPARYILSRSELDRRIEKCNRIIAKKQPPNEQIAIQQESAKLLALYQMITLHLIKRETCLVKLLSSLSHLELINDPNLQEEISAYASLFKHKFRKAFSEMNPDAENHMRQNLHDFALSILTKAQKNIAEQSHHLSQVLLGEELTLEHTQEIDQLEKSELLLRELELKVQLCQNPNDEGLLKQITTLLADKIYSGKATENEIIEYAQHIEQLALFNEDTSTNMLKTSADARGSSIFGYFAQNKYLLFYQSILTPGVDAYKKQHQSTPDFAPFILR